MQYIAFVFGIFGFMAYLQISSLKKKVADLERELTGVKGTSYQKERSALLQIVRSYIGKKVDIELKEDHQDVDIVNYGNSKYGSNIILDVDDEWVLLRIESKKGKKDKLIRLESVNRISMTGE